MLHDLRHALRTLAQNPAFTATAVLVLALGIGVNTAVFSVVNAVLLEPVRVPEPERLVFVMSRDDRGAPFPLASPLNFTHWRNETGVFEDVAAWRNLSLDYSNGDTSETITVGTVSADYFRVLRAPFAAGRGFLPVDDAPGAAGAAVISHRFWTERLGRAADAVGRTISLGGRAYTVVGIAARDFDVDELTPAGPETARDPQVFLPLALALALDASTRDEHFYLHVFARLKDGVTLAQADERLALSLAEYRERYPDSLEAKAQNPNHGFTALPVRVVVGADVVPELRDEPPRQIVGIVSTLRAEGIHSEPGPAIYFPLAQTADALNAAIVETTPTAWTVRTRPASAAAARVVREEVSRATGEPTIRVLVMDDVFAQETAPYRLRTWLMGVFGGAALLLAAVGIYGLIANAVEQRRHEIGIRMALGAEAAALRRMVIRDGMLPVVIGVAAGLVAAYFLANLLAATLFGVEPRDAGVFTTVPFVLAAVGLAAAAVPAFRASRVSPTAALRHE